jgi:hypothetical protein
MVLSSYAILARVLTGGHVAGFCDYDLAREVSTRSTSE